MLTPRVHLHSEELSQNHVSQKFYIASSTMAAARQAPKSFRHEQSGICCGHWCLAWPLAALWNRVILHVLLAWGVCSVPQAHLRCTQCALFSPGEQLLVHRFLRWNKQRTFQEACWPVKNGLTNSPLLRRSQSTDGHTYIQTYIRTYLKYRHHTKAAWTSSGAHTRLQNSNYSLLLVSVTRITWINWSDQCI